MSEYPLNEKNNTFTWLISLYSPYNNGNLGKELGGFGRKLICNNDI